MEVIFYGELMMEYLNCGMAEVNSLNVGRQKEMFHETATERKRKDIRSL
jgi:hypothetical protein